MTTRSYEPGMRVRIVAEGERYTGHVGTVENTFADDDGTAVYSVRFCGDRDNYPHHLEYHFADGLEPA